MFLIKNTGGHHRGSLWNSSGHGRRDKRVPGHRGYHTTITAAWRLSRQEMARKAHARRRVQAVVGGGGRAGL